MSYSAPSVLLGFLFVRWKQCNERLTNVQKRGVECIYVQILTWGVEKAIELNLHSHAHTDVS